MQQTEKLKALDAALTKIEKDYGKGAVMKLGEYQADMSIETTPTGSLSLDIALGVGGIPRGRVIEIYGPESSGKTTVALHAAAATADILSCRNSHIIGGANHKVRKRIAPVGRQTVGRGAADGQGGLQLRARHLLGSSVLTAGSLRGVGRQAGKGRVQYGR